MSEFVRSIKEMSVGTERLVVYRSPAGGIFALDASAVEQNVIPFIDPYTGKSFSPRDAETRTLPTTWWCCGVELDWGEACSICNTTTEDD